MFNVNDNDTRMRSSYVVLVSASRIALSLNLNLSPRASLLLILNKVLLAEVVFALEHNFDS